MTKFLNKYYYGPMGLEITKPETFWSWFVIGLVLCGLICVPCSSRESG